MFHQEFDGFEIPRLNFVDISLEYILENNLSVDYNGQQVWWWGIELSLLDTLSDSWKYLEYHYLTQVALMV